MTVRNAYNGKSAILTDGVDQRSAEDLRELKRLLVDGERSRLAAVEHRLNDPVLRAEEISQALPDALTLGTGKNQRIARAMAPTIDSILKSSVQKNPKALADAIFPALGPAIRKSIASIIMGMIQSLNQMVNHSFTLHGLKWRLEAMRTRRPFAEVILLHTLVYRVEQVFLIHKDTGILLSHAQSDDITAQDPDLVSGMLTAIQDFVKDSFDAEEDLALDTLRMEGDHSVWIEDGAHAAIAAVIRGTPPVEFRKDLRDMVDRIHQRFGERLLAFQGDTAPFEMLRTTLTDGLHQKRQDTAGRISPVVWILLFAGVAVLGVAVWGVIQDRQVYSRFIDRIRSEPGIVLSASTVRDGKYELTGLKDPLARDIRDLAAESGIPDDRVVTAWEPYQALTPAFILRRAHHALAPPNSVDMTFADSRLTLRGAASHRWIATTGYRALAITGIESVDMANLIDTDMTQLADAARRLEAYTIYFPAGNDTVGEDQRPALEAARQVIITVQTIAARAGIAAPVIITGTTDPSGGDVVNRVLSRARADAVRQWLVEHQVDPIHLTTVGAGAAPNQKERTTAALEMERSVTFHMPFTGRGNHHD